MSEIEFEALIGEHALSGFDTKQVRNDGYWEDANVCRFVLDGRIYVATEDPEDGYRSSLRSLEIVDGPAVKNVFPSVKVIGRLRTSCGYGSANVLEFIDAANGRTVLEVGTDNDDDYYPSFVGNFYPDRMSINQVPR